MSDILEEFKNSKFLIMPNEYEERFEHLIVLCDIDYWCGNLEDLYNWCDLNQCEVMGMTVNVPDDMRLTLFILRWL